MQEETAQAASAGTTSTDTVTNTSPLHDVAVVKKTVGRCVLQALDRFLGGNNDWEADRTEALPKIIDKSISFTTKNPSDPEGTPHDVEVRICTTIFHRLKRRRGHQHQHPRTPVPEQAQPQPQGESCDNANSGNNDNDNDRNTNEDDAKATKRRRRRKNKGNGNGNGNNEGGAGTANANDQQQKQQQQQQQQIYTLSDLGLRRTLSSPRQFSELFAVHLEELLHDEAIANDVRCYPSGIIFIVTNYRAQVLRNADKLPCPYCTKWCKGSKGLWWHQQRAHSLEHSDASSNAASIGNHGLAMIPYTPQSTLDQFMVPTGPGTSDDPPNNDGAQTNAPTPQRRKQIKDPFECVRDGDMTTLQYHIHHNNFDPASEKDRNGSYLMHWAAGCGELEILKYLIATCGCDAEQPQHGKRSFVGRTPLHWSARNGHLDIVRYLITDCKVNLEKLTIDGTSAFCWAAWQGHLDVLRLLLEHGCDVQSTNKFGCNAALWCAQGVGGVDCLRWLHSVGVDLATVNNNGHSILHKCAQRGHMDVLLWYVETVLHRQPAGKALQLVGPDSEGQCPSDLAGVEGHVEVGKAAADMEMALAQKAHDELRQLEQADGHADDDDDDDDNGGTHDVGQRANRGDEKSNDKSTGDKHLEILAQALSIPTWLLQPVSYPDVDSFKKDIYRWEPYAGVNRMRLR